MNKPNTVKVPSDLTAPDSGVGDNVAKMDAISRAATTTAGSETQYTNVW